MVLTPKMRPENASSTRCCSSTMAVVLYRGNTRPITAMVAT